MSEYRDLFRGKRITMLGLGLLGRAVGDAEFLAQCGAELTITDTKSAEELAESVKRLRPYDITFHLGAHEARDFREADMVIKAAGVPLDSPEIAAAVAAEVPVYMSTALFAREAMRMQVRIIGVTGTRGKSTITYLINRTLAHASLRTHLGGNIRGVSTLALLPQLQAGDFAVLELDSWQLQGFGALKISPQISILSNLMKDHMNYYGNDMDAYFADKANIFKYQQEGDTLVVGASVLDRVRASNPPVAPRVPEPLPKDWMMRVPGEHNRENAALARAALQATGLSENEIRTGIETFLGAEGRLQFLGEKHGVKIYNDNNATTPEASVAALRALDDGKRRIVLIAGGSDKGLDMSEFVALAKKTSKRIVLLAGSGTDRIKGDLPNAAVHTDMKEAVRDALGAAGSGDTLLFSPGFASFGMFKNEYDRGDQFLALVK